MLHNQILGGKLASYGKRYRKIVQQSVFSLMWRSNWTLDECHSSSCPACLDELLTSQLHDQHYNARHFFSLKRKKISAPSTGNRYSCVCSIFPSGCLQRANLFPFNGNGPTYFSCNPCHLLNMLKQWAIIRAWYFLLHSEALFTHNQGCPMHPIIGTFVPDFFGRFCGRFCVSTAYMLQVLRCSYNVVNISKISCPVCGGTSSRCGFCVNICPP